MIEPRTLKGFRDFLPKEARKRQYVMDTLRKVFESYGFEPLETPALEYEEILTGKYGEEGDKLMYRFEDNGGRRVALRYDQTVPLARVAAQYGSTGSPDGIPMPFKRYQIQPVWRAENTQKGRYREFVQCDIDTVGVNSALADAEIIAVIATAYQKLGFTNFKVLVNDRSVFSDLSTQAIIIIDKLKKIGEEEVIQELSEINVSKEQFERVKNASPTDRITNILTAVKQLGIDTSCITFEPTLARGLDYYTGLIVEVEIEGFSGSVGGGGRYDKLIGMFGGQDIPAVGFAFGFDRTIEAMDALDLFSQDLTTTQILVTVFSPELLPQSLDICTQLRSNNINTEIYLDANAKMEKQLKYADKKKILYVMFVGPEEVEKNQVTVKNMKTGEQKKISKDNLASIV